MNMNLTASFTKLAVSVSEKFLLCIAEERKHSVAAIAGSRKFWLKRKRRSQQLRIVPILLVRHSMRRFSSPGWAWRRRLGGLIEECQPISIWVVRLQGEQFDHLFIKSCLCESVAAMDDHHVHSSVCCCCFSTHGDIGGLWLDIALFLFSFSQRFGSWIIFSF